MLHGLIRLCFFCAMQMLGLGFAVNNTKVWTHAAAADGVMVQGDIFLPHFGALSTS